MKISNDLSEVDFLLEKVSGNFISSYDINDVV